MERERWAELSAAISDVSRAIRSSRRHSHDISLIIRTYLWAVLHDRPVVWACEPRNWWPQARPCELPSQPTMSRRTRTAEFERFMAALSSRMRGPELANLVKRIDGKALAVARHSTDPDATSGRGVGGMQRGYKLHAVWGSRVLCPKSLRSGPSTPTSAPSPSGLSLAWRERATCWATTTSTPVTSSTSPRSTTTG